MPCYFSYVIGTLLTEVEVIILESRIVVGGGVVSRTEGGLISFLVLGGTC